VLKTDRVQLDFDRNEGIAEGAVLRFMDVPILALPTLSFPLGDGRKSGWLPPTLDFDTRSGLSVAVPYYWNIAPNRDATFTPTLITRRGAGLGSEFRYLEDGYRGQVQADVLPNDRVAGRSRWAVWGEHDGTLPLDGRWHADGLRVSDDAWWKDFPKDSRSQNARLLPFRLEAERDLAGAGAAAWSMPAPCAGRCCRAATCRWCRPTNGRRSSACRPRAGCRWPATACSTACRPRSTASCCPTATAARPNPPAGAHTRWARCRCPGASPGSGWCPGCRVNAWPATRWTRRMADGRTRASRAIPSVSVEAGLEFERDTTLFGRSMRQTLEPRALYVNTPFRDQTGLPNFDSAGKDFNFNSIFSDNAFSGVDRVSDAHQVTAGVTTRLLDATSGAEALRLGLVQRYLLRTQQVTPEGVPFTQRFSDLFLLGLANLGGGVALEGAVQYSTDTQRTGAHHCHGTLEPGRLPHPQHHLPPDRGLTEQVELGWQWPIWKRRWTPATAACTGPAAAAACGGTWYAVGRVNYSMKDARVTDSILGLEYDAGCWIVRVVAERLSTGSSDRHHAHPAAARTGRPVAAGVQPAQGLEGQYPRLPPAARRAQRLDSRAPSI
jgi:LPS-assembly protein